MVRTLPLQPATRPEPARIVAIATAIAVHALAFLLLLLPLVQSLPSAPAEMVVTPIWVQPRVLETPPLPPKPVEPRPVPPAAPAPRVAPEAVRQPAPVVLESAAFPSAFEPPLEPAPIASNVIAGGPPAGVELAYAQSPAPRYPAAAARARAEGTVLLMVLVDTDGQPLQVTLHRTSGNRLLDRAALDQVARHWRFQPAMRGGRPVQAYGVVPIEFSLQ